VSGSLQLAFSDYDQVYAKKKTRRQTSFDEMEDTIPLGDFYELIRQVYPQPTAKGGGELQETYQYRSARPHDRNTHRAKSKAYCHTESGLLSL
jgi:hypothetical protein